MSQHGQVSRGGCRSCGDEPAQCAAAWDGKPGKRPLVDLHILSALARDTGNMAWSELMQLGISQIETSMLRIDSLTAQERLPAVALECHRLRSCVGVFGVLCLQDALREMESLCAVGSAAHVTMLAARLRSLATVSIAALKHHMDLAPGE